MIPRRKRVLFVAPVVAAGALLLTGCDVLSASGSGTVTIRSTSAATTYNGVDTGSVAFVCAPDQSRCWASDPYLYSYYPIGGDTAWNVSPGFPVVDRSGQTVGLPAGRYTLQVTEFDGGLWERTNVLQIDVYRGMDLTIWHQSYGRDGSEESCRSGWQPGWAQWPNDGTGGFVCNRQIYAYYPDLPVTVPGASSEGTPWLQSLARASGDAPCPDGYSPGWAQWPNEGRGGAVCNRTIT